MKKTDKPELVETWEVHCPGHAPAIVTASGELEAGVAAARFWGVAWTKIAAYLDAKRVSSAYRRKCARCGKEYFTASIAEKYGRCPGCEKRAAAAKAAANREMEQAYRRRRERRRNA